MRARHIGDIGFSLALLALVGVAIWQALEWRTAARLFPTAIGAVLGPLLLLQVGKSFHASRTTTSTDVDQGPASLWSDIPAPLVRRRIAEAVISPIVLAVLIWTLGFVVGGALGTVLYVLVVARERWVAAVLLGGGTVAFFYLVQELLQIKFPDPMFGIGW